jgi:hypothetical protein
MATDDTIPDIARDLVAGQPKHASPLRDSLRRLLGNPYVINIVTSAIFAIAGYLFGVWSSKVTAKTVRIGFTHHTVDSDTETLRNFYVRNLVGDALTSRILPQNIVLTPTIVAGPYDELFKSLNRGDVHIGFVPPFNFLSQMAKPDYRRGLQSLQVLGTKMRKSQITYRSGLVFKRGSSVVELEDLRTVPRAQAILGLEETSTSTRVVPIIYLLRLGLRKLVENSESDDRPGILRRVRNSRPEDNVFGALSDEDWDRVVELGQTDGIYYLPINEIQIPYDVVVASARWENDFDNSERASIVKSLRDWMVAGPDWEQRFQSFGELVSSGIVVAQENTTKSDQIRGEVNFPPLSRDLCGYSDEVEAGRMRDVSLWKLRRDSVPGSGQTVAFHLVGHGTLEPRSASFHPNSFTNSFTLSASKDSLIAEAGKDGFVGLHVFPANIRSGMSQLRWCKAPDEARQK